ATLFNQAAALLGWGGLLVMLAVQSPAPTTRAGRLPGAGQLALLVALGLSLVLSCVAQREALPASLAYSNAGMVLASGFAVLLAAVAQRNGSGRAALRALCVGLVVASLASSAIGMIQVFAPSLADGAWVAKTGFEGRAVGNMRQPNHLSSLLLWGIIAVAWLGDHDEGGSNEARSLRHVMTWAVALLFIFCVVLTASRTGAIGTGLLTLWALLDRRLSRPTRWLLGLMPLFYLVFWLGNSAWADYTHHVFGGETRFSTSGDISSSRYAIWRNTLELIKMHPWFGVGFGEFNFAWTLTPFPDRPVAFFDHTHNLPLQLIVEMGIPLGLLVLGLLLFALYRALRNVMPQPDRDPSLPPQAPTAAFMIVLMIGLHSLLEYPLWYAYFLLPTAFAWGLCLGDPSRRSKVVTVEAAASTTEPSPWRIRPLLVGSLLMLFSGAFVLYDYMKVAVIFSTNENAPPLRQRIAEGRRSVFFAHHADYAAATVAERPSEVMYAFKRATHYLLDARLMMAWAKALNEAGETDKARYVAQRLMEFRNEQAAEFFAPCSEPGPAADKPFQCQEPTRVLTYEDFR
ncbi:MAG TPA: Wzy polymerase domain-containing protein, partial [Burkholderiaceae bacterium]